MYTLLIAIGTFALYVMYLNWKSWRRYQNFKRQLEQIRTRDLCLNQQLNESLRQLSIAIERSTNKIDKDNNNGTRD